MSENKTFYWLKLKEDFFKDDTMRFIESQPNGIKYSNVYLKLLLCSLRYNGSLVMLVGNKIIPYDIASLSDAIHVDADTVRASISIFCTFGLIQKMDTGELYMAQINELCGKETDKAAKMRRLRAERANASIGDARVTMLPERYPENRVKRLEYIDNNNMCVFGENDAKNDAILVAEEKHETKGKSEEVYSEEFEEVWKEYPRKKEKRKAYRCYNARRVDYTQVDLLQATKAYAEECKKRKTEECYIKLPATFFGKNEPFADYLNTEDVFEDKYEFDGTNPFM